MNWKDRSKSGDAVRLITLDWDATGRAMAELRNWRPKHIDAPLRYSSGTSEAQQARNIEAFVKRKWPDLKPRFLMDHGISGYKCSANTGLPNCLDEDKALGHYLAQARRGEIPPDTMVILDNLPRFSSAKIEDACEAAMTLLRNGITLLFLHPKPLLLRPEDRNNNEKWLKFAYAANQQNVSLKPRKAQ